MKVYIVNILPSNIKQKLNKLDHLLEHELTKYEIVSEEFGIQIIEKNKLYRIEPRFDTEYEVIKNYKNCDLLVDKTKYTHIPIISQLPVKYVLTKITQFEYKTNKKSKLKLVVECIKEPINFKNITSHLDKYEQFVPINFYLVLDEVILDMQNIFLQEEINRFLSHLN